MEISSFQSYLLILFILLTIISVFVFRQFIKTRNEEINLVKYEQKGIEALDTATELYEFGSIQIKKRLYSQATQTFLKAMKKSKDEPNDVRQLLKMLWVLHMQHRRIIKKQLNTINLHYQIYLNIQSH